MRRIKDFVGLMCYMFVMVFFDSIPNALRKYKVMISKAFNGEFEIAQSDTEELKLSIEEYNLETKEELYDRMKNQYPSVYYNEHFPFMRTRIKGSVIGKVVGKEEVDDWDYDNTLYSLSFVCRDWFKPFYIIIILLGVPLHALFQLVATTFVVVVFGTLSILRSAISLFIKDLD